MQSRVVGRMESWRGGVRRGGLEARGRLTAAWRAGKSPGGSGVDRAESGSRPVMSENGAGEEERIARGTGVKEQIARGAAVRDLNSVSEPGRGRAGRSDRRENVPEQNRVPSWLATGAAWSWRLLLLATAIYLISRLLGILYIVVVPCIAALLLTALLQPLTARLRRARVPRAAPGGGPLPLPPARPRGRVARARRDVGHLAHRRRRPRRPDPARHQPGVRGLPDHGGGGQAHDQPAGVVAVRPAFSRQEQQ